MFRDEFDVARYYGVCPHCGSPRYWRSKVTGAVGCLCDMPPPLEQPYDPDAPAALDENGKEYPF